jgi:hypothetical protein
MSAFLPIEVLFRRDWGHYAPTDHKYYTQVNMTRTIEQILGLPPMNPFDLMTMLVGQVLKDLRERHGRIDELVSRPLRSDRNLWGLGLVGTLVSMARRPALNLRIRDEVLTAGTALHDVLTGALYPLDEVGRAIVAALQIPSSAEALLNRIATGDNEAIRGRAERELRGMLLCGLFEQTCETSRQRLRRMRDGEVAAIRVLEGSRFGCQHSGGCCRGYLFGYLRQDEKERIESLDPRSILPDLHETPLFIEAGTSLGKPVYRLGSMDDACVFLENGTWCALHRVFGATAKPSFCQLFPLAAFATIEGFKVYDRGECASFATSVGSGTLLAEDAARVRSLVTEDIYHPVVHVHGPWRCDYGLVLALARRLDQEASERSPFDALHTIGYVVRGFVMALARCPFEEGQPESAADDILSCPAEMSRPSQATTATNAGVGLRMLAVLAEALVERAVDSETLGRSFKEAAAILARVCRNALGETPLSERARAVVGITVGGDSERMMRLSLRQLIFGRELLLDDDLPAGLLRMAFVLTMTLVRARLQALDAGEFSVSPRHFSAGHMVVRRMLHRPGPHGVLKVNGEQAWPILDALPRLSREIGFQ